jgi:hypothetical protein
MAARLAAGAAWEDHDLVFCQPNGRPIDRSDDWRAWKNLLAWPESAASESTTAATPRQHS